jgi:phage tail sheath gpL-like
MTLSSNIPQSVRASQVFIDQVGIRRGFASQFIPPWLGLIGQYDVSKTGITDYAPQDVLDSNDVGSRYGWGSHIHRQALKLPPEVFTSGGGVTAFPLPEQGAGTAATLDVTFTGAATSSGTLYFNIGDVLVFFGVAVGATPTDIAAAYRDAILAIRDVATTSTATLGVTTITAKGKGTYGNQIYVKQNPGGLEQEKQAPAGVAVSGADAFLATGATDPSVHDVFLNVDETDKLGNNWYTIFTAPYTDATNLGHYIASGNLRNDPAVKRFFGAVPVYTLIDRAAALTTPATLNSEWIGGMWDERTWAPGFELAAEVAGIIARELNLAPPRPYKTLPLSGGGDSSQPDSTYGQEDALFRAGMGFLKFDSAGILRLGDVPLTRRTDDFGGDTEEWLDYVSLANRQAKVYSIEQLFLSEKYQRGVVVDNNAVTGVDFTVAPKDLISDMTKLIEELWVPFGWTKNGDEVIASLKAEINAGYNSRIDSEVVDDEAKALRIVAMKAAHLY